MASGIAAARARGVKWGRPKTVVDLDRVRRLRSQGKSWRQVARALDVGIGTLYRNGCQAHGRRRGNSSRQHAA